MAEEDFVRRRQAGPVGGPAPVSAADFHRWLTMARLEAASAGSPLVTAAHWARVLDLEDHRVARLPAATAAAPAAAAAAASAGVSAAESVSLVSPGGPGAGPGAGLGGGAPRVRWDLSAGHKDGGGLCGAGEALLASPMDGDD